MNKISMDIKFELNKLYYKYIDRTTINHYRLLLITEEYYSITKHSYHKYPIATEWINLNKPLYDKQTKLKNLFFENMEIICKSSNIPKDCIVCSNDFQSFYAVKYHYEKFTLHASSCIMKDIKDIQNMKTCEKIESNLTKYNQITNSNE